jgi:hypothetical protein
MKLIDINISGYFVHVRFADTEQVKKSTEWIDFRLPLWKLDLSEVTLDDLNDRAVAQVRLASLRCLRDLIAQEIEHNSVAA